MESAPFVHVEQTNFDRFFSAGEPRDLYETLRKRVETHAMLTDAFRVLGATTTAFRVTLRANETTQVDFARYGIPFGATILDINQMGMEGPWAFEWQSESSQQRFSELGVMQLFGVRPHETVPPEGDVSVVITWTLCDDDDISLRHLIDAARHFSAAATRSTQGLPTDGHFDRVIIPANIAVESAIGRVMFETIRLFTNKENAERFLSDGATYAHQLKVLLPMVAHLANAPPLPNEIRGALDRLRGHRNKLAHRGESTSEITRAVAAEMFTAAMFGHFYAGFLGRAIEQAKKDGRMPA